MATCDVTVRGGGIFGLSVAWACLKRGARVRLIDIRGIGTGASGGVVGALAPHVPENWNPKKAFQLESLLMAEDWWAEVSNASGQDPGYARHGRLQPIADAAALELARKRAEGAARLWQGRARWQVVAAAEFPGWAPPSATGFLIHDTLSARIPPARACAALAKAIRARGGEVIEGSDTPDEGAVVHATGWEGLRDLSQAFGREVGRAEKGQALLLGHDAGAAPQIFADALHIVPQPDGTTALGSTSERSFDDPLGTDDKLDALLARAIALCPALATAPVLTRWAGLRPRAATRAPILGAWPDRPGHFIANGGFKIGFGIAPKLGEGLAELILEGRNTIPAEFDLTSGR